MQISSKKLKQFKKDLAYYQEQASEYKIRYEELKEARSDDKEDREDLFSSIRSCVNVPPRFLDELSFLRQLVNLLVVPKEKMEELEKIRKQQKELEYGPDYINRRLQERLR